MTVIALPAAVLVCLALPRTVVLWLWSCLSFVPGANILGISVYSSLGSVVLLLRTPLAFLRAHKFPAIVGAALAASATAAISALWSPSQQEAYAAAFGWLTLTAGLLATTHLLLTQGTAAIGKVLLLSAPVVLTQAATTILFRFQPQIELAYYGGPIARAILGSAASGLTTGEVVNNVLEADRAGGFLFTSVNRAALVMGVMLMTYAAYALLTGKRWPWLIALTLGAAVFLGGSKTGFALAILLPAFAVLLGSVARSKDPGGKLFIVFGALIGGSIAIQIFLSTADDYIVKSEQTLVPRLVLWSEATRAIAENPIFGLGFGGWFERWQQGNVRADFTMRPAHNWFLQAWLDGGIVYAAALVAFVFAAVLLLLSSVSRPAHRRTVTARAFAGSAFLWCFIHGLGDNTPLYADSPAVLFLCICGAIMLVATMEPLVDQKLGDSHHVAHYRGIAAWEREAPKGTHR